MDVGILISDLPTSLRPADHFDAVLRQVDAAQRNGMKYLPIGQHFVFPDSRWLQPVPLLARLAAEVDPDVRLVTTVMIAPVYPPVLLAEELATLDIVSEGRLIVGLGTGYLREEYAAFGVPFEERFARFEECIAVLEALWTSDRVTFHGRFTTLDDVPVMTRPVQQPRPPLWLGAMGDVGVRRAARLADAWIVTPTTPAASLPERFAVFAAERERAGRPMGRMPLRREIVVGRDRDDALARAAWMGRGWYDSLVADRQPPLRRVPDRAGLGALELRVRLGRRRRRRDPRDRRPRAGRPRPHPCSLAGDDERAGRWPTSTASDASSCPPCGTMCPSATSLRASDGSASSAGRERRRCRRPTEEHHGASSRPATVDAGVRLDRPFGRVGRSDAQLEARRPPRDRRALGDERSRAGTSARSRA